jgi:hypothetical protein
MDPLSITASIGAVLTLTAQVVGYMRDTKDATNVRFPQYDTTRANRSL